jgi:CRISPR-associated protein Cmr1
MTTRELVQARRSELYALTDIWTGDATTAQTKRADRLIPTGLLGSLRWWFEVLVRGLGGVACDPSASNKQCQSRDHCVVCELFGCTGWARKFRFDVRGVDGGVVQARIMKGTSFQLNFMPLRAIRPEEWALLELTLRLIADFGAFGGKTVLKPSEQNSKPQHADFGLVRWSGSAGHEHSREQLATHVHTWAIKPNVNAAAWASCRHMWFVDGKYLTRQDANSSTFNRILGRPEPKSGSSRGDSWLAGSQGESKKIFSFRSPARTFGFMQHANEFDTMCDTLRGVWNLPPSSNDWFVSGDALLNRLCGQVEALR